MHGGPGGVQGIFDPVLLFLQFGFGSGPNTEQRPPHRLSLAEPFLELFLVKVRGRFTAIALLDLVNPFSDGFLSRQLPSTIVVAVLGNRNLVS